jgi:hypothetical protein
LAADEAVVLGCFLSPRAYSGRIAYGAEEAGRIGAVLAKAARPLIASFGSPFVFEALAAGGLCAFSRNEAAQRAAARALSGELSVTGRMPVALRAASGLRA